jgi:hypothetical protein
MDVALSLNPSSGPTSNKAQEKAAELASKEIDKLKAHDIGGEEHRQRKRHLIKGPNEFRDVRSDLPNKGNR